MRFMKQDKERGLSPVISHIAEGTVIEGDIDCEQELLISGHVKGNIRCTKNLVVAEDGRVLGNVCCEEATIMGSIEGDINCKGLLVLQSQSSVLGKITSQAMEVHAGAKIESEVYTAPLDLPQVGRDKLLSLEIKEVEMAY